MGRTKLSAGRMAREPSVPKLIAVETSPPTTTIESTPSSPTQPPSSSPSTHHLVTLLHPPSQPDQSPSLPPANRPPESTKNNPSSSPPSKPDTKKKANKPRPEPKTHPLTLRSGKKIAPPLTRAQPKLGILENTPQTQGKQQKPPVIRPHDTDQPSPSPSRRRAAPRDFVFPAPKRKKARMASGASSLPPDNLHFPKAKMQLRIRPNRDKAPQNKKKTKPKHEKTVKMKKKTKPKHEKTVKMKKKTKPKHEKTVKTKKKTEVDEVIEDVVSSHSNDDISSLHTNVGFLTTVVLVNNTMLKEQQAQLNRLQRMVQTRYRGL